MITMQITSARHRALRQPHALVFADGTNAFATMKKSQLHTVDEKLREQDREIMSYRRDNSMISLQLPDGQYLHAVPGCGALMGDSNAPQDFAEIYEKGIHEWRSKPHTAASSRRTMTKCPFSGKQVDIGHTTYADDIASIVVANTADTMMQQIKY